MPEREEKVAMVGGIKRLLGGIFHSAEKENAASLESSLKATSQSSLQTKSCTRCDIGISKSGVLCKHSDGVAKNISWKDLESVTLETTGEKTAAADIFWILAGASSECRIPQAAVDNFDLLEAFQDLPGFDNDVVIEAVSSMEAGRFSCWKRGGRASQAADAL